MSSLSPLGFSPLRRPLENNDRDEYVVIQRPLQRVLAFTRRSIDDVVNCPIVKNEVLVHFRSAITTNDHKPDPGLRLIMVSGRI
jgi:hypothetical protein